MKVWVLAHRGVVLKGYYWTGDGLGFTNNVASAVWFVRERDAAIVAANHMLDAVAVEKELPDRDEPDAQSAAGDGAVNP
jgi:hypothetical protein